MSGRRSEPGKEQGLHIAAVCYDHHTFVTTKVVTLAAGLLLKALEGTAIAMCSAENDL